CRNRLFTKPDCAAGEAGATSRTTPNPTARNAGGTGRSLPFTTSIVLRPEPRTLTIAVRVPPSPELRVNHPGFRPSRRALDCLSRLCFPPVLRGGQPQL